MKTKLIITLAIVLLIATACAGGPPSWTDQQVVDAFQVAGLEADNSRAMTKDDYGLAPYVCTGTRFFIPSLGEDNGGRIFACDDAKELESLETYYTELGKSSALFFSWVYKKDNILVQINGNLPEDQAKQYEAALDGLK